MSKIYHYTKLKTAIEIILPLKQLRTNFLNEMNDPKENTAWTLRGLNIDYKNIYDDYSSLSHIAHQQKLGREIKNKIQALCFVNTEKNSGYDNEMMWAHYGDNHKGICLEIDTEKFIRENRHIEFFKFENIGYELNKKPMIRWDKKLTKEENISNIIETYFDFMFLSKSHFWEKESEKRLLIKSENRVFLKIESSLTAVYSGLYTNIVYDSLIENLLPERVKYYRLNYGRNKLNRNEVI